MAAMTEQETEVHPIYPFNEVMSFNGTPDDLYGGHAHAGAKRKKMLMAFMKGEAPEGVTYWRVVENEGFNVQITDPRLVIWPWEYRNEAGQLDA